MGRRLSLILMIFLLASPGIPAARGQDDGKGAAVPEAAPLGPPGAATPLPGDFTPVELPPDPDAKPKAQPKADPKIPAPATKAKKPDPPAKAKPATGDGPVLPASPDDSKPAAPKAEVAGAEGLSIMSLEAPPKPVEGPAELPGAFPPIDAAVTRTDGTNKPAAAGTPPGAPTPVTGKAKPVPGAPGSGMPTDDPDAALSSDHIPLGPQTVAVTVDVQAPKSMNLNQEATLRLVIKNNGASDAMNVRILDELPEGLNYISSQPPANVASISLLSWSFRALPAGSEQVISVKVTPVKTGAYDHAATVLFQTASRSQTQVFKPLLKVDQTVSKASVLKGQPVEFKIGVTNMGDGPARNVTIRAKLSTGLRHGTDEKGDEQTLELVIPTLAPNQREELDPLVVDAIQEGDQACTVTALSPDVIPFTKEDAENIKTVTVVAPRLNLAISAPEKRFTDTVAVYEIKVSNPGTAPARKVRVVATLPVSGRLVEAKGARFDSDTRRLQWSIDPIEPGGQPRICTFAVRMGGVGYYEVSAEAHGDANLAARDRQRTEVVGMPDVDLVVSERLRVVDVGGKTTFQIRLHNYGTKEATNLKMTATLSKNLQAVETAGLPSGITGTTALGKDGNEVLFVDEKGNGIKILKPQQEIIMGISVQVTGADPKVATCRVSVTHDNQADPFEDMARINVTPSRFNPGP
jgi:uncharacterized repeat protein (TIGR01451 family)